MIAIAASLAGNLTSPRPMQDWNIQSRAHECHECGQAFVDRQSYRTLLLHDDAGLNRLDLCGSCWEERFRDSFKQRAGFLSCWQGTYEAPPPPNPEAIRKDTAEDLLRKLVERNDTSLLDASYILAVMLERKRIIKVKDEFRDDSGRRIQVYEHPKTGDVFTIPDPGLRLDQLEAVQSRVADLMEHGLPGDADAAPDSPDSEDPAPAADTDNPTEPEPPENPTVNVEK